MSRRNMRPGKCERCGASVAAQAGTLQGPPWIVVCAICLPFGAPERPRVRVDLLGSGTVQIQVGDGARMGDALFSAYRAACVGAKPTKDHAGKWVNRCPVDAAAPILERLRALELDLDVDAALLTALQARASEASAVRAETDDRLTAIDAALAARGQALYPYQRDGVRWLAGRTGALLADSPGLGKSAQALLATPAGAPILVVCPAVAKGVWIREAAKWRPELRTSSLKGKKSFRWPVPGELISCNYDILPAELPEGCPEGLILVCDEAHAAKNPKALRTKRVRALAKAARAAGGRVWLLTGTPLLGRPPELWALLSACGEEGAFRSFPEFAHLMGGEQGTIKARGGRVVTIWQWFGQVSPQAAERLKGPMLRRRKDEVLADLPPKRWEELSVNGLDSATREICDDAWEECESYMDSPDELPRFEMLSEARAALASAKIPSLLALIEDLEEQEEPCVVFSAHRAPIDTLSEREGWAVITGDTSAAARTEIENRFQRGELRGIGATIQAGGTAITLTRASRMIFVDLDWTPALNEQAEDRIHRIGSERPVLYTILVADHALDRRIAEVLSRKRALIDASVDAARLKAGETPADQAARLDTLAANLAADSARLREELERAMELESTHAARAAEIVSELAGRLTATREESRAADTERRLARRGAIKGSGKGGEVLPRRAPETPREEWALAALTTLAAHDPDRARSKNDVGFNRSDNKIGHPLAERANSGGLTDREWLLAAVIAAKYWRQVGEMPGEKCQGRKSRDEVYPQSGQ